MATYIPVRITGPETHRLADMGGVLQDLSWVVEVCDRLLARIDDLRGNTVELEALESAAIVRYARCFNTGVRTAFRLDRSWIDRLPAELQAAHDVAYARREKHIAHSVNDWELNEVTAQLRLDEATGTREVVAVSVRHYRALGLARNGVEALRELARATRDLIRVEFDAERARLLPIARAISMDELERRAAEDPAAIPGRVGRENDRRPR
jgi:hypothetical protein